MDRPIALNFHVFVFLCEKNGLADGPVFSKY